MQLINLSLREVLALNTCHSEDQNEYIIMINEMKQQNNFSTIALIINSLECVTANYIHYFCFNEFISILSEKLRNDDLML